MNSCRIYFFNISIHVGSCRFLIEHIHLSLCHFIYVHFEYSSGLLGTLVGSFYHFPTNIQGNWTVLHLLGVSFLKIEVLEEFTAKNMDPLNVVHFVQTNSISFKKIPLHNL